MSKFILLKRADDGKNFILDKSDFVYAIEREDDPGSLVSFFDKEILSDDGMTMGGITVVICVESITEVLSRLND